MQDLQLKEENVHIRRIVSHPGIRCIKLRGKPFGSLPSALEKANLFSISMQDRCTYIRGALQKARTGTDIRVPLKNTTEVPPRT